MRAVTILVCICLALTQFAEGQEGGADRLRVLKEQFEELRADLFAGQVKFDERYAGELEKLRGKAVAAGDLELTLEVRKEKEEFAGRSGEPEYSKNADLARLQKIYADQSAKLAAERAGKLKGLMAGYLKQLEELKAELTRADKIDEAVVVQAEVKRVEGMAAEVVAEAAPPHPGERDEPVEEEVKLPKTKRQLEDYLIGSIWNGVGVGQPSGKFSFRESGEMGMPWHKMKWETTGKREVRMFTEAWNFNITFSDDLETFEVRGASEDGLKWTATFESRVAAPE